MLEQLQNWLTHFPLWEGPAPLIDRSEPKPNSAGLFPLGLEQLARREDVSGGVTARYRWTFLLRCEALHRQAQSAFIMQLQEWICQQDALGLAPRFGTYSRIRAQKGRLVKATQTGTALYEVKIIIEFEKEN